jgi:hypothetical protein
MKVNRTIVERCQIDMIAQFPALSGGVKLVLWTQNAISVLNHIHSTVLQDNLTKRKILSLINQHISINSQNVYISSFKEIKKKIDQYLW